MAYTPAQRKVIRAIRREAVRRYAKGGWSKAERRKLRSAFLTGRVESNFQNLSGGDADSQGWRQERASLYPNPTNLRASVRRYFNEADKLYRGDSPASLSGRVQRPASQYLYRYGQHRGEGIKLAKKTIGGAPVPSGGPKTTRTKRTVIPGVDRSGDRRALLMDYLEHRDEPDALLGVARGLREAQDVPRRVKTTRKVTDGERPAQKPGKGGSFHGGGGWGGSKNIVMYALNGMGASNFKRTPQHNAAVGGSPTSDHLTTNRNAYAADVAFGSGRKLARRLGIKNWSPGSYARHIVTAAGGKRYSVQILEKVEGHYDHTHIGVQAL